ncbi:ABC transporter permease, partial [Candidatus Aerophobetes bacterium]|nr:ABC transporter permease [Candidatus Aerophobetes bacterium]
WQFLLTSIRVLAYILLGVFFFGVNISRPNIPAALLVLILTILAFSSLGIISASFIMVFKRGNPPKLDN